MSYFNYQLQIAGEQSPAPLAERGFTMVEVMVALMIFAIGMLGLARLQATALQNNHVAYQHTVATRLAYDMTERVRANPAGALGGAYNSISSDAVPQHVDCYSGEGCSAASLAAMDAHEWLTAVGNNLPSGRGEVSGDGRLFTVTVMWDQDRTGAAGTGCGAGDPKCVRFKVQP